LESITKICYFVYRLECTSISISSHIMFAATVHMQYFATEIS